MDNKNNIDEIRSRIKEFIIDNFLFGSTDEPFSNEDSFLEKGIIDSTGILELIEFIEENYEIKVEDDEMIPENLDSLQKVSLFIQKKIGS